MKRLHVLAAFLMFLAVTCFVTPFIVIALFFTVDYLILTTFFAVVGISIFTFHFLYGHQFIDEILSNLYSTRFITKQEVEEQYPKIHELIAKISAAYNLPFPNIGVINEKTPITFSYGTRRSNARIIFSKGIFDYLDSDEVNSLIALELGHIVYRDSFVLTFVTSVLFLLHYVNRIFAKSDQVPAFVSLFYLFIQLCVILCIPFFSRAREFAADAFAAKFVSANSLTTALVKVPYGIAVNNLFCENVIGLLKVTRQIGITDYRKSAIYGLISHNANHKTQAIEKVIAYDLLSPWAKISEFFSTHPLTGKRIVKLNLLSVAQGIDPIYNIQKTIQKMNVSKLSVYFRCTLDFVIVFATFIAPLSLFLFLPYTLLPSAIAVVVLLHILYVYPYSKAKPTTILEQMCDIYAMPMRSTKVELRGKIIGKRTPGYIFDEDRMYDDGTGLVPLNNYSLFGVNDTSLIKQKNLNSLEGVESRCIGWFIRGAAGIIELESISSNGITVKSYPRAGFYGLCALCILISLIWSHYSKNSQTLFAVLWFW